MASDDAAPRSSMLPRAVVVVLYGSCSVIMVLSNKALLSNYAFDFTSTLLLLQNGTTLLVLAWLKRTAAPMSAIGQALAYPPCDRAIAWTTAPIAIAYLGNVACGLVALKLASVPVYQVLKRLAPLPAMLIDGCFRGVRFSLRVRSAVLLVAGGAVLTGFGDASFDAWAYSLALASCVLQALYLVLTSRAGDLGLSPLGVLHYNALLSLPLLLLGVAAEAPQ